MQLMNSHAVATNFLGRSWGLLDAVYEINPSRQSVALIDLHQEQFSSKVLPRRRASLSEQPRAVGVDVATPHKQPCLNQPMLYLLPRCHVVAELALTGAFGSALIGSAELAL
jgi:hypothetical protein